MAEQVFYPSLTTPNFNHDLHNIVVEIILLGKYKQLPLYCWRKGSSLQKEWGQVLMSVKFSLKKLNITCEQILLFLKKTQRTTLSCSDFGLVHYYVNNHKLDDKVIDIVELVNRLRNVYPLTKIENDIENTSNLLYQPIERQAKKSLFKPKKNGKI